jgi:hypothetical protein
MIRLSRLFTPGVKSRRVKDVSSTICSGTFAINESCYGQGTIHRHYVTGPQGIFLNFIFVFWQECWTFNYS